MHTISVKTPFVSHSLMFRSLFHHMKTAKNADLPTVDVEAIKAKLAAKDIAFVATREVPGQAGQVAVFFSCRTVTNATFLIELKFKSGLNICKVTVKSPSPALSELCKATVSKILSS